MSDGFDTDNAHELTTEGGEKIYVPKPDNGHPIIALFTRTAGLQMHLVGPTDADLDELAGRIAEEQLKHARGEAVSAVAMHDAMFGEPGWITPVGVLEVVAINRGYAKVVDVTAMESTRGRIAVPELSRAQRRHPLGR